MANFVFPTAVGWLQIDDPTYYWPVEGTRPTHPPLSSTPSPLPITASLVRGDTIGLYTIDFLQPPKTRTHPWDILMAPEKQTRAFTLVLLDPTARAIAHYTHTIRPTDHGTIIGGERIYKTDDEVSGVFDAMTSAQALVAGAFGLLHPSIPAEQELVINVLPSLITSWRARHGSHFTGSAFTVGEMRQAASIYDEGLLEEARELCQERGLTEVEELINPSLLPAQTSAILASRLAKEQFQFDLAEHISESPLEPAQYIFLFACLEANLSPEKWEQVGNIIFPEAQIDPYKTRQTTIPIRRALVKELLKAKI